MVTQAMDINTDPSCSGTIDSDRAVSNGSGPDVTMVPVAVQVTLTNMVPVATCFLDTNMATGCDLDPRDPCGLWWQLGSWTSAQPLAVVGPWIQMWSLATVQAWMSPWPQEAAQATYIGMVPVAMWSSDTNMAPGG